jgi:hypothetical protein
MRFADKEPRAIWRGHINNRQRAVLIDRYHDHPLCDVGKIGGADDVLRKPFVEPSDQLGFKYVLCVEGFDVATNLKWVLGSNSLCLMPRPTCETWLLEGRLEAGKHYGEVREDFGDLPQKIAYYEQNPDEALDIVANANRYMAQFFDERREQILSLLVMYKYFVMTGQMEPRDDLRDIIAPSA